MGETAVNTTINCKEIINHSPIYYKEKPHVCQFARKMGTLFDLTAFGLGYPLLWYGFSIFSGFFSTKLFIWTVRIAWKRRTS